MEQEKNGSQCSDGRTYEVLIPFKLPSFNEYTRACRSNKYIGASMKKDYEEQISVFIAKLPKFDNPIRLDFVWMEDNKRRDADNIAFSKKFILDAMVKCGKIKDDSWRYVKGFTDSFEHGKEAGVRIIIEEVTDV